MKRIALAFSLLAPPALAQQANGFGSSTFLVCVGEGACGPATIARCSVALGDGAELPPNSRNILVLGDRRLPLYRLDDQTVWVINHEIARFGGPPLSARFVKEWNEACGQKETPVL